MMWSTLQTMSCRVPARTWAHTRHLTVSTRLRPALPPLQPSDARLLAELTQAEPPVRLDNLLAQHGLCLRRESRQFCRTHTVTAVAATPRGAPSPASPPPPTRLESGSARVDPRSLCVNGEPVPLAGVPLHIALHKPVGAVCSHAEEEGGTVYALLPGDFSLRDPPVQAAGRLDRMASGLLVLTQSGALNERLASPRWHAPKEYVVSLAAPLSADGREAAAFASGSLELADGHTAAPVALTPHRQHKHVCRLVLHEGRYHQIRRMFAAVGAIVTGIHRTAIGGLRLADVAHAGTGAPLAPGEWALLTPQQLHALLGGGGEGEAARGDEGGRA